MDIDDLLKVRFLSAATKPGGNCMEPIIPEGVMIVTSNDPLCLGKICVVHMEGNKNFAKRLFYEGGEDLIGMASEPSHRYFEWHFPLEKIRAIRPVVLVYDKKHPPFLEENAVRVERALARPA